MKRSKRPFAACAGICALMVLGLAANQVFTQTAAQKPQTGDKRVTEPSAEDLNIRAYMELLRSDVRSRAEDIVAEIMRFQDSEAEAFWPIYREYESELGKQGDRRFELIKQYSDNYQSMSDDAADQLVRGMFELEQERSALKRRFYERMKQALSAKTAARFLQVHNQILMLIDLQIASSLPVIQ